MTSAFFNNPITHGVVSIILFALPLIIMSGGSWQSLTLGGLLAAAYQALKNKANNLTVAGKVKA